MREILNERSLFAFLIRYSLLMQYERRIRETTTAQIEQVPAEIDIDEDHRILKLADAIGMQRYNSEYVAGISILRSRTVLAWFNHQMYHTSSLALNLIHNAAFGGDYSVEVTNAPLKFIRSVRSSQTDGVGMVYGVIIGVALSFYVSTFIMFYIRVRSLQSLPNRLLILLHHFCLIHSEYLILRDLPSK